MTTDTSGLHQLGQHTLQPTSPDTAELERVPNPHPDTLYLARFTVPEFTSLCPVTGQPDFAHIVIDYAPGDWLVESKSLKLYLTSFRNHGAFHEDCTVAIGKRIADLLQPKWLRIGGNPVDGHHVPVPHFGVVLAMTDWQALADRLVAAGIKFEIAPYVRFRGEPGEQATMFFRDPSGNAIEMKAFNDLGQLFAT